MRRLVQVIASAGIEVAATVGAGMFAVPYVFSRSGWLLGIGYMAIVGGMIIYSHTLYDRVLKSSRGRLITFVSQSYGPLAASVASLAVVGGLLFTLIAYILLGSRFLQFLNIPGFWAVAVFWAVVSLPALFSLRRLAIAEYSITAAKVALIILFFVLPRPSGFFSLPAAIVGNPLFLFSALLFAFAGWTAVEPVHELYGGRSKDSQHGLGLGLGTIASGLLYILFAASVVGSISAVSADTVSSAVFVWPSWKVFLLMVLGVCAVASPYIPVSDEIKNTLIRDLNIPRAPAVAIVVALPIIAIAAGVKTFESALGLSGGVFISLQYICILAVARARAHLSTGAQFLVYAIGSLFCLAAAFELYRFFAL